MTTHEFTVVVERGEESGYVATCSTLDAVCQGATVEGALADISEAIKLVLADMATSETPIPADRGATAFVVSISAEGRASARPKEAPALGHDPTKPIMTAGDLLNSGLVGMWADRDDIGDSTEFARTLGRGMRQPFDDE